MPRMNKSPYSSVTPPSMSCPKCPPREPDQQFRAHLHWLRDFADQDELRVHLAQNMTASKQGREFTQDNIDAILQWRRGVISDFSRDIDENGAKTQIWEAWCMAQTVYTENPCRTVQDLWRRLKAAGYLPEDRTSPLDVSA